MGAEGGDKGTLCFPLNLQNLNYFQERLLKKQKKNPSPPEVYFRSLGYFAFRDFKNKDSHFQLFKCYTSRVTNANDWPSSGSQVDRTEAALWLYNRLHPVSLTDICSPSFPFRAQIVTDKIVSHVEGAKTSCFCIPPQFSDLPSRRSLGGFAEGRIQARQQRSGEGGGRREAGCVGRCGGGRSPEVRGECSKILGSPNCRPGPRPPASCPP